MGKLRITVNSLNIRQEPTLTALVIGSLNTGEEVTEVSLSSDQKWYKITTNEDITGWIYSKYAVRTTNDNLIKPKEEFPWMPIAIQEIGVKEYNGVNNNPRVIEYLHSTANLPDFDMNRDETAWCAAYVNWCLEKAGYAGTDSAWARSFANWGKKITTPRRGCIAVFKRGVSSGHVAFFVSKSGTTIKTLGGNQGDEVCISTYSESKLIGYRIPSNWK